VRDIVTLLLQASDGILRFQLRERQRVIAQGHVSRIGQKSAFFEVTTDDEPYTESVKHTTHRESLLAIIDYLHRNSHLRALLDIHVVVHRFAYGGNGFRGTTVLTPASHHALAQLVAGSRDMPAAVASFDTALRVLPNATHIGLFDSAAYQSLPTSAATLPLSPHVASTLWSRNVGGDGILHLGVYHASARYLPSRRRGMPQQVISILIDERTSVAALSDGFIIGSSDAGARGLPGLHETGAISPAISSGVAEMLHEQPREVERHLMMHGGISAMTGRQSYAEVLAGAKREDVACVRSLMYLCAEVAGSAAAMATNLGGVDAFLFSGSGASREMVEEICRRLACFGVVIDPRAAKAGSGVISARGSKVRAVVVDADMWSILRDEAASVFAQQR
jgi:propionate kinase